MRHKERRHTANGGHRPNIATGDERDLFAIRRQRRLSEVRPRLSKNAACHQNDYKQQLQHVGRLRKKIRTQSALIRDPKRTNRKRTKLSHLHRHSEEPETAIRQLSKTAEMLDDRNIVSEQNRVCRTIAVARRVDVERINPDERCCVLREMSCRAFSKKRMIAAGVFVSAPVLVPTGVDQHRLALHVNITKSLLVNG